MQVEKGGSWKGSSRFFFFFFFFALAGPWMAAGHFTGADSKKSSLSGATKKKTRISTCSSGVLFNFLRNQMLEITAAPKHLKCCVARSHFCWKCVSSCREEGKRWQRWTWFDRRSLSLSPLSFHSSLIPLSVAPTRLATEGGPSLSNFSTSRAPPSPHDLSFLSSSSCLPSNPHSCSARGSRRPAHVLPALGFFPFPLTFFFLISYYS